ncbi:MAG: flippase [Chloroflexota bacterium]|jgi:O-antigen/teichoic acid export membrane protein
MNTPQRLLSNTALAYTSTVIIKAGNVLLFILLGRLYGPEDAGIFNLGITFLTVTLALSAWGLHELLVREVAPRRNQSARYFVNFISLRLLLTLIAYAILLIALRFLLPYSESTTAVIIIISLAVFPEAAFAITHALFTAHEQLHVSTVASIFNSGFKLVAGYWLINQGQPLEIVAWVIPIGSTLGLLVFIPALLLLYRKEKQVASAGLSYDFTLSQLRLTPGFILIGLFSTIDFQLDTFLISLLLSEEDIGWYGAAQTIVLGFWMVAPAVRTAIYPIMARYYQQDSSKLSVLYQKSTQYLLLFVLPVAMGVTILAQPIILLIYGPAFLPSVPVLQIMIWSIVFAYLSVPSARLMILNNRQHQAGIITGLTMLTNLLLNFLLITRIGVIGAALARTTSTFFTYLMLYGYSQRFLQKVSMVSLIRGPFISLVLMSVVVWFLRDFPLYIPIVSGGFVYCASALIFGAIPREDRSMLFKFSSSIGKR